MKAKRNMRTRVSRAFWKAVTEDSQAVRKLPDWMRAGVSEDREALADKTSREDKMLQRYGQLRCAYCPPHQGENAERHAQHGSHKPKRKQKTRATVRRQPRGP